MISTNRGVIFGSSGRTRGRLKRMAGAPANTPATQKSNATAQFGRSQERKPVFGGRTRPARR